MRTDRSAMKELSLIALMTMLICGVVSAENLAAPPGNVSDQSQQISLAEAFVGRPTELRSIQSTLQTQPRVDVTEAYNDGTLVARVQSLAPLLAVTSGPKEGKTSAINKSPKAFVAMDTLWRQDNSTAFISPAGKLMISVCWLSTDREGTRGRALTQQAVEATWEYYGAIKFFNWGKCQENPKGIKIGTADERPWSYYGIQSESQSESMLLNFTFADPAMSGCAQITDTCIWSLAVHEFGHALGFIHEQDANSTPDWCTRQLKPADIQAPAAYLKAKLLTQWDQYSVMDYCFDIYKKRVQLSDCDIAAYRVMYGELPNPAYRPRCKTR